MKKQIGFVNIDSLTAAWLRENMPQGALKSELSHLFSGDYSALMLEYEPDGDYHGNGVLHIGALEIDARGRRVLRNGEEISLTPKEFDILLFLAENRGEVFTKEQIYQAVWKDDYLLDDSNIMAFIRKLRKKIEPNPDAPEYILTIWGVGYKFNDRLS